MADRYEAIPYLAGAHAESHPSRIAAVAQLHGLVPVDPRTARILELGCARGRNLIPVAARFPEATCVGVDLSERQIADARVLAARLGLGNARFEVADLAALGEAGPFDYVVAHGVLSWLPRDVAPHLFSAAAGVLSQNGVLYASYNALPGWYRRAGVRDLMQLHAARFDDPRTQVREARAVLKLFAHLTAQEGGWYASLLKHEHELIADKDDWYVAHDHLEADNHPYYVRDVAALATAAGLQYLGEADHSRQLPAIPPEVHQHLQHAAGDPVTLEQYLDVLSAREFRCTLFCRGDRATMAFPDPSRIVGLHLSSRARPKDGDADVAARTPVVYASKRKGFQIDEPILKATLQVLAGAWPAAVKFEDLYRAARGVLGGGGSQREAGLLAESLVYAWTNDVVTIDRVPPAVAPSISDRPVAFDVARAQIAEGDPSVASLRHGTLRLSDFDRSLITHLDGRSRSDLIDALLGDLDNERFSFSTPDGQSIGNDAGARKRMDTTVAGRLAVLHRHGLLVA